MLDHIGLTVRNVPTSRQFYVQALAPLGYAVAMDLSEAEAGVGGVGLGEAGKPEIWLMGGATATTPRVHLAFRAADRATVDAFYRAAMAAGATDNGPPGLRPEYHPNYYGAFVLDPDGTTWRQSVTSLDNPRRGYLTRVSNDVAESALSHLIAPMKSL